MIQSMTGYGQVQKKVGNLDVSVEIKSLNNKSFDVNFKLPKQFNYKEPSLRTYLNDQLTRGKIFFSLEIKYTDVEQLKRNINHDLIKRYFNELAQTANSLDASHEGLLSTILTFPEIFEQPEETNREEQWEALFPAIEEAVQQLIAFRQEEGRNLYHQLKAYGESIQQEKASIVESKDSRYQKVRDKIHADLSQFLDNPQAKIDKNRFEQEVLYYLEKIDITEELDRLNSHFDYYFQTLEEAEAGRKLNFITQEMGREINTIGSKINDAAIQQQVVGMKENLEKIKEQVQNIL